MTTVSKASNKRMVHVNAKGRFIVNIPGDYLFQLNVSWMYVFTCDCNWADIVRLSSRQWISQGHLASCLVICFLFYQATIVINTYCGVPKRRWLHEQMPTLLANPALLRDKLFQGSKLGIKQTKRLIVSQSFHSPSLTSLSHSGSCYSQ